jgi:NADH:ubiquinone oxidoreductase subunit 5 (subunit L)/multisubunit Na+/H+ antiporter MnhA subunit
MDIVWIIQLFILIPLLGFLVSLFINPYSEKWLSRTAFITSGLNLLLFVVFFVLWVISGFETLNLKEFVVYRSGSYEFLLDFYFDKVTAVYLFVGSFLTFLIIRYSRYYLHREVGYKRFFNTVLFFYLGYNITIFSGNFETLFIGWEVLGLSSFLLIAFYRNRYLPVSNAVKVFSIYRIGDVGILLAMWASHHLWHENITFLRLNNYELVHEHISSHSEIGMFISFMLLIASAAKSAQLPFSSWLPRAMEGPTPSSAIFYGSLSVHFGVFLLLRTFPFWEHQPIVRVLIGLLGFMTAVVAFFIARVQSTVKSQIAYSSIVQIGIIFMEAAAGLKNLALIHFTGNAFLRTYQLLVSPSVVSYLIRDQFYNYREQKKEHKSLLSPALMNSIYVLSLKEWNLDRLKNKIAFSPLKKLGHRLDFLNVKNVFLFFIPTYLPGMYFLFHREIIPGYILNYIPETFSFIAVMMVLKAFSERKQPRLAWLLVLMAHLWITLAVSFNEHFDFLHSLIYLCGIIPAGVLGYICLQMLRNREPGHFSLNGYYGHVYEYPRLSFVFLLAVLGLMGFPVSFSFLGEDLIFSHIHQDQFFLAFFNAVGFIVGGIALIRMYARLFLGPHVKNYHENPYRSA